MIGEERREFQRLLLSPAVPATLGSTPVSIIEVGVLGARVEHSAPIDARYGELHFTWNEAEIAMKCEIVRSSPSQSAMRFLSAVGSSGDHLRKMLGELVVRALEDRRTGSEPIPSPPIDGDTTVRGRDAAFVTYRLDEKGSWQRRRVFLPEQPASGFTVARTEDSEEMQRLCRLYSGSDDEGRRLIRLFAELSVSQAMGIPPRA